MYKIWKNILNQENPLKFLISKILINLKISKYLIINQKGYKLHFFPSELSRVLWINPTHPHTASIFFSDYLQPGDTVIDVGSNIGTTTIQSSINVGKTGKIFSIEPNPTIYEFLLQNIKLNKLENIKTFNIAAGESDGEVNFSNKRSDVMNKIVDDDSKIKVKMTTIDKLLIDQDIFNLLKIDVIGYEKFVLLGSKNILKKLNAFIFQLSTNNIKILNIHMKKYLKY